jgi:hypothetical protein
MMDIQEELRYIHQFAVSSDFEFDVCRDQIRALWTAYCLHHGLDVDTAKYDADLLSVWNVVSAFEEDTGDWGDFDSFDDFMCEHLI